MEEIEGGEGGGDGLPPLQVRLKSVCSYYVAAAERLVLSQFRFRLLAGKGMHEICSFSVQIFVAGGEGASIIVLCIHLPPSCCVGLDLRCSLLAAVPD